MTDTTIATKVHKTLNAHGHFAPKVTLNSETGDFLAQTFQLWFGQVLDLGSRLDIGGHANRLGARAADAENRLKGNNGMLVVRDVYACDTGQTVTLINCTLETRNWKL